MKDKCKWCRWHKINSEWVSECHNRNSSYCCEECIEKDRKEPQECEDKEIEDKW